MAQPLGVSTHTVCRLRQGRRRRSITIVSVQYSTVHYSTDFPLLHVTIEITALRTTESQPGSNLRGTVRLEGGWMAQTASAPHADALK